MAAYGLSSRSKNRVNYCDSLPDSALYYPYPVKAIKPNKAPFLSSTPRKPVSTPKWTDALYDTRIPSHIPNCSAFRSKTRRFPYEAFSKEDLEELLCRCGFQDPCECPIDEKLVTENAVCQGKIYGHLIRGPPPRSHLHDDGSMKRAEVTTVGSPDFYDTRVYESTTFYHGWKWSKWKSERFPEPKFEKRPGPADYTIDGPEPAQYKICMEEKRSERRKNAKLLRFMDMVQRRNIIYQSPGPADYSPELPKGAEVEQTGSKAVRFPSSKLEIRPGPADYTIKGPFDPPEKLDCLCPYHLPEAAAFGIKAPRFRCRIIKSPGPADYDPTIKLSQTIHCSENAPFNCSAPRFKKTPSIEDVDDEIDDCEKPEEGRKCPELTWQFRSKAKRFKPIVKCDAPGSSILTETKIQKRSHKLQYLAPFNSSDGRFLPWYNYMGVYGNVKTPGPGYYALDKPKGRPAVHVGPISRCPRSLPNKSFGPAPNSYYLETGVMEVLHTHNERLKNNVKNRHKYKFIPLNKPKKELTIDQRYELLWQKTIAALDVTDPAEITQDKEGMKERIEIKKKKSRVLDDCQCDPDRTKKPKLLRYFLYNHQVKAYS